MTIYHPTYCFSAADNSDDVNGTDKPKEPSSPKPLGRIKLIRKELSEDEEKLRRLIEEYLDDIDGGNY